VHMHDLQNAVKLCCLQSASRAGVRASGALGSTSGQVRRNATPIGVHMRHVRAF
jgi:hypothetical protein